MTRSCGQSRDRPLQIERRSVACGICHLRQPRCGLRDFVLDAQPTAPRQHRMDGDTVQPGGKSTAPLETRQSSPGRDEGFLSAVLGRLALTGEAQAKAVDSRREWPGPALE